MDRQYAAGRPPTRGPGGIPGVGWKRSEARLRTFTRYLLLESPGWAVAVLVAVVLHRWLGLSAWWGAALVVAWVGKDVVLYRFVREAYSADARTPKELLLGKEAVVVKPLRPVGVVRLRGELWRAEAAGGSAIARGRPVRVQEVRGLTLLVVEISGG
jgi:membrane protein implicated in regulation of membrane protease activity